MKRLVGSLAIFFLAAVMTAFGYAQTSACCKGKCGCGENATCTKAGHCDDGCAKGKCCGKDCAKSCCEGQMAGKDCGSMCAHMQTGAPAGAACCHGNH